METLISQAREYMKNDSINYLVYHSPCMDGNGCVVAALLKNPKIELIPFVHGKDNCILLNEGNNVLFVDCVPTLEDLKYLESGHNRVMILDHHYGNALDLKERKEGCFFDLNKSGTELAWEYFHDTPIPELLKLIGRRDVWDFSLSRTRSVGYALMKRNHKILELMDLVKRGEEAIQMLDKEGLEIENEIKEGCETMEVEHKTWRDKHKYVMAETYTKTYLYISECAEYLYKKYPDVDFVVVYYKTADGKFKLSFRTDKSVDVSSIAKNYGGNGHLRAAGAIVEDLFLM
jgi:nanoRNase/pAp phosphatase (c-di-AMP/oligoRNAs hydrolase)